MLIEAIFFSTGVGAAFIQSLKLTPSLALVWHVLMACILLDGFCERPFDRLLEDCDLGSREMVISEALITSR